MRPRPDVGPPVSRCNGAGGLVEATVKGVQTEIPEALIAAQRERLESWREHVRLSSLAEAAQERWMAAIIECDRQWDSFRAQVAAHTEELARPPEEGGL